MTKVFKEPDNYVERLKMFISRMNPANWVDEPEPVLKLTVVPVEGSITEFDKLVSDLQSDIVIGSNDITGTLNYVTGYTGFSGDVSEQSGHYIALKITANKAAAITGQVIGGTHGPVTLDPDGEIVCRIASTSQSLRFIATTEEETATVEYALTDLVLQPEPVI